jgi:hypothetical protein
LTANQFNKRERMGKKSKAKEALAESEAAAASQASTPANPTNGGDQPQDVSTADLTIEKASKKLKKRASQAYAQANGVCCSR